MARKALVVFPLALLLVAGCGKGTEIQPEVNRSMTLTSSAFSANGAIPAKYSAEGGNVSPSLAWSGAPEETKSFALIVDDPDAPRAQPFVHWVVYNIPSDVKESKEGQNPTGATAGKNDAGTTAYYGPKPPSGTHHYIFRIYALDASLQLGPEATKDELIKAMQGHELAMGELVGTFAAGS